MESAYEEVVSEVSCTPTLPDLEEVVEVTVLPSSEVVELTPPRSESRPKEPVVTKKTPFLLLKQPIIPEVLYRWQLGFRKGPTGYRKVIDYSNSGNKYYKAHLYFISRCLC